MLWCRVRWAAYSFVWQTGNARSRTCQTVLGIVSSADAALVASNVDVPKPASAPNQLHAAQTIANEVAINMTEEEHLNPRWRPHKERHQLDTRQEHASHDAPLAVRRCEHSRQDDTMAIEISTNAAPNWNA